MNRTINHQDVLNLKTRIRLLFLSLLFGAMLGAAGGWRWAQRDLTEGQSQHFPNYLESLVWEKAGLPNQFVIQADTDTTGGVVVGKLFGGSRGITAAQFLKWAREGYPTDAAILEAKTRQVLFYFPLGGALFGVGLLFILSSLIKSNKE